VTEEKQPQGRPHPPPPPSRPNLSATRGSSPGITPLKAPSSGGAASPHPPVVAPAVGTAAARRDAPPSTPSVGEGGRFSQATIENALVELTAWRREVDRRLGQIEAVLGRLHAERGAGGQARAERTSEDVPVEWSASAPAQGGAYPAAGPAWGAAPQRAQAKPAALPVRQYDLTMKPGESIDIPSSLNAGRKKRVFGWLFVILIVGAVGGLMISAVLSNR
jgi:hypothetical protein